MLVNINDKVLIETPTKFWSGRVMAGTDDSKVVLDTAAWIACTGRYMQAVAQGEFDEVEPVASVTIPAGAILAILPLPSLPTVQR